MATRAFLALGSNLGDRDGSLRAAVAGLIEDGIRVVRSSSVYETLPVGPPQPSYLNAVIEVETDLDARALLDRCLAVEARLGRERGADAARWGPRTIDIDLLTFGDEVIDRPGLVVPHPRMHERAFVMVPLADLTGASVELDVTGIRPWGPPLPVPTSPSSPPMPGPA